MASIVVVGNPCEDHDEVLVQLWANHEDAIYSVSELVRRLDISNPDKWVRETSEMGWIALDDDRAAFTDDGRKRAADVVRRHRLAECLLVGALGMGLEDATTIACISEHTLQPEITDGICTALGHPSVSPSGRPIPLGPCCQPIPGTGRVTSPMVRLSELRAGESGTIEAIAGAFHKRLDRLGNLGVVPGTTIKVHQRTPSFVIHVGGTQLALDTTIAHDIFVRKLN